MVVDLLLPKSSNLPLLTNGVSNIASSRNPEEKKKYIHFQDKKKLNGQALMVIHIKHKTLLIILKVNVKNKNMY